MTAYVFDIQQHRETAKRKRARSDALIAEHIHTNRAQAAELRHWANRDDLYEHYRQAALDMADRLERNAAMLERTRTNARMHPEDHEHIARILPAIAGALGSRTITARDILRAARLPTGAGLRITLHTTSARSLGRLLKRCDGVTVNRYRLKSDGHDGRARAWHVEHVG